MMDLQTQLNRLEQQLAAFEKLHREELEVFSKKLEAFRSLQADELKMIRAELDRLRLEIQQAGRTGT